MVAELHHSVRERFGDTLCYYFLGFEGTYDFEDVQNRITEIFHREEIKAFATFEIFGAIDVIIRAWMPSAKVNLFQRKLFDEMTQVGRTVAFCEPFHVSRNSYHHLWPDGIPSGSQALLDTFTVNQINDKTSTKLLTDALLLRENEPAPASNITLFISVPAPSGLSAQDRLTALIAKKLKDHTFSHAALYEGLGRSIALFIEASVPASDYFQISAFNRAINEIGLQTFGLKTTTYLTTGNQKESEIRSILSSAESIDPRTVADYLTADESDQLEIKGSFSVDLKRYLRGDSAPQTKELQNALQKEVLSTIVAFLNSDGGEIVIGAVEEKKFQGEQLALLQAYPLVGEMRVVGIELEYTVPKDKTWDGYSRRLEDLIKENIGTTYSGLIKIKKLAYSYDADGEKRSLDLCLIKVARLPGRQTAYLNGQYFYVRSGAMTRAITPKEVESYRARRRAALP